MKYYIKQSIKRLIQHGGFSALNIVGLTLGISSCLLIILYVNFELSFDKFHKNYSKIYRVVMKQPGNQVVGSSSDWWVVSPFILKPTWELELPEIELVTRTSNWSLTFKLYDQFVEEAIQYVDPEFLDLFTFPLVLGEKHKVLDEPFSIVISQKMAKKYFGDINPIGKTIVRNDETTLTVTGVLEDVPENSHLKFDFLVSYQTIEKLEGRSLLSNNWLNNSYTTYLVLKENTNIEELDGKLRKYDVEGFNGQKWSFHLQPLTDIHFNRLIGGTGNKGTIFIFISVGCFILFIAGFNYMNLFIAHYRTRTKNIGIMKILGVSRSALTIQFLSESFLLVFASFLISLVVAWLVLPLFNTFIGEHLSFSSFWNFNVIAGGIGVILLMTIIAGMYPALYLSRLKIIDGIKGGMEKFSSTAMVIRKSIVAIQFSVSIMILIGTITVYRQLNFANNKSLGFTKENILYVSLNGIWYKDKDGVWKSRVETLKQELLKSSNIIKTAASTGVPTNIRWSNIPVWEGQKEDEKPFIYRLNVDEDFLDLYGIEIEQGRNFSSAISGDMGNAYILNQAAVKSFDFKSPVGAQFGFNKKLGTVVGVVKDFNFESIHKPITPLGIGFVSSENLRFLSIKISNVNIPATIKYIEDTWHNLTVNVPFKYSFIDEQLNLQYKKDQQLAESLNYFSFMAILISCLGIFGLMSISIKERTKELGIRKVLGVSFHNLLFLLLKDTIIILIFASFLGGFLGWLMAQKWLANFAYRIDFSVGIIIISSLITFLLAFLPVIYRIVKAAKTNPINALRHE
jgi:putative ABC transport system permease protein